MRKTRLAILCFFVLLAALALSCAKEDLQCADAVPKGEPVELTLRFGAGSGTPRVVTKSTLGLEPENKVFNVYVFIFDMDRGGEKIYADYFDTQNLSATGAGLQNWWEVSNNAVDPDSGTVQTYGTIHLHTISQPNCRIVAIANIDAEMVNISPEQLSTVKSYSDLYGQKARLNQLITSRSGYFPMSGELGNVDTGLSDSWGTLSLKRLDAKIEFRVFVDTTMTDAGPVSRIAEFEPLKWQVVNIPRQAYVLERGAYAEGHLTAVQQAALEDAAGSSPEDYFDLRETNFETEELTSYDYSGSSLYKKFIHGFSFYMMENRKPVKNPSLPPTSFAQRELQSKEGAALMPGNYVTVSNGAFVYPDPYSTYVIITGRVRMDNVTYNASTGATLSADVRYVVHLGDFSDGKWEDFNVFRNHSYVYNIVIRDVNDIRVEVDKNYEGESLADKLAENEPGASGRVTVALEEIYTSDAHYSSHVISFHAKNIDAENVSWVVKTPFNPSGASPVQVNGVEITSGLDYQWVEFRVNEMNEDGIYFEGKRQVYKPMEGEHADGHTMNITSLVNYLRQQKRLYDAGRPNAFDRTPTKDGGPKISVTAFVNEYYYEKNPITGAYQKDLWKQFVNQPMRYMYILSDTKMSADGESQVIGASFTIQQKSIQSIFNASHPDLNSAWGCEHTDDEMEQGTQKYDSGGSNNRGNNSETNGRINTLKEWALVNPNGSNRILGDITDVQAHWDYYMNLRADNETPIMWPKYQYLRYSCMSRNRDNNGNGVIDEEEVRWYMGSHNQLIGLFMGSYGIEGEARLYQRNVQDRSSTERDRWRQHIIASTQYGSNSSNQPYVIWGEECLSASDPSGSNSWANGLNTFSTRCLRNLGYDPETGRDMTFSPYTAEPDDYVVMRRMRFGQPYTGTIDDNVYYEFDVSRLNEASLRYYTNRELVQHDEDSEQACLYPYFRFAPKKDAVIISNVPEIRGKDRVNSINEYLNKNIGQNPYCPAGYRLPNLREMAVLRDFMPEADRRTYINSNMVSRTYWSFGLIGKYYNPTRVGIDTRYGWGCSYQKVFMLRTANETTTTVRCVQDVKDGNWDGS